VIVFVGAWGTAANACFYIGSLIGFVPAVNAVTTFVPIVLCRLLLIVVVWMQEKILFLEGETTAKSGKKEEVDDDLEYLFIC
jgi:hypothetical protein